MQWKEKIRNLMKRIFASFFSFVLVFIFCSPIISLAREKSINPGINEHFENPDVEDFIERFEGPDRAVYVRRHEIIKALNLKPGNSTADIGAGTGFFSFLMAQKVGQKGRVYAIDIAKKFVNYINETANKNGLKNVKAIQNTGRSTMLEEQSVDRVLICDTYHHFEYPFAMLSSIRKAMKPDAMLVLVDFERIKGKTAGWIWNMVRAGKGHFMDEIIDVGFELIDEVPFSEGHYILRFKKREMENGH